MREVTETLFTKLKVALGLCRHIGHDAYGNRYFETVTKQRSPKRWVVYRGKAEGSKVPPLWHAWIHHTIKQPPLDKTTHPWQKEHRPNLSGTAYAYNPTTDNTTQKPYQAWTPKG